MEEGRKLSKQYVAEVKAQARAERQAEVAAKQRAEQERERKERECQASFWCRNGQKVKNAGAAGMNYLAKHADVMGVIAGVGIGLACTALTGGAGALACGALGGMVSGLVTGGLKCYGGDKSRCSAGSIAQDALWGAAFGLAGGAGGGALGGAIGGKIAGTGIRAGVASVLKEGASGFGKTVRSWAPAWAGKLMGGTRNQTIYAAAKGSLKSWGRDIKDNGGGLGGFRDATLNFGGEVVKNMGAGSFSGGAAGAVLPTTRDDWAGLRENNFIPQFHPVSTPIQIFGGAAGGAF